MAKETNTQLMIPDQNVTTSVANFLRKESNSESDFDFYTFNDVPVPRVTKILDKVINKPGLLYWAANIGTKNMYIEKKKATSIGTKVHHKIEYFLKNGHDEDTDYSNMYSPDIHSTEVAYMNFKNWFYSLSDRGYHLTPIAMESKLVCPYYGGTIDLIAEINGARYVIDWKTSKSISLEYFLQTAAYMWAINNGYSNAVDHVDGIGVVRLDKAENVYEDSFLTYPIHAEYIDYYIKTFGSLLQSYYYLVHVEQYKHKYSLINLLEEQ